jgi:hypothetical protein
VLAPVGRDAALLAQSLGQAGFVSAVCPGMGELCAAIEAGAGAIILAEESLDAESSGQLDDQLARQPSWSDLPVVVLLGAGASVA